MKQGTTYHALFMLTATDEGSGNTSSWAAAQECSCAGSGGKLQWKCRVVHSTVDSEVGAEWKFDWELQDGKLKSWRTLPDGTHEEPVTATQIK